MYLFSRAGAWLWVLLGALLLLSAAFYNGYPLVTSDTGTYIDSGVRWVVPDDRPITYGVFIRLTGWRHSLWYTVLVQSLLLAGLLFRCLRVFAPRLASYPVGLAVIGVVAWGTGLSWFSSQIMPDIFTPIGALALMLVLLAPIRRAERFAWSAVAMLAALMHSSNLLTFTLLVLLTGVVAWATGCFGRWLHRSHFVLGLATVLLSWVALPGLHYAFGGGFTISRGAHVFLMGKLVETGLLDRYLNDRCDKEYLQLCQFRDKLPNNAIAFIWNEPSIPTQMGGWEGSREEFNRVIKGVLTSPRYYPQLLEEGLVGTARQLMHVGHGDGLTPFVENSNPFWKVQESYRYELKEYTYSAQNRGALDFKDLTERSYATMGLSLLALLALLTSPLRREVSPLLWLMVGMAVLAVVINAGITANLANVLDRLQTRIAWLLPWAVLLAWSQAAPALWARIRAQLRTVFVA